ncbi:MAG: transporter, family, cyanate transporter [Streptosporangiaceae bacterium]|nr:transporter, family, cyanate transporter [Streptosporangiaceae bacterium]
MRPGRLNVGERRARLWSVGLIVLVALNLRPAITAVGPLLTDIRTGLGLSSATAGALTTLPVLCFGAFGLLTPALRHRFRGEVLLVAGMILLTAGLLVRTVPSLAALFAGTLVAGIAISVCNVTVPAVIKRDHPGNVTFVTAVYSTALTVGAAIASGIAVPIKDTAGGGWRLPLGLLAIPALLAGLAWVPRARRGGGRPPAETGTPPPLWRDRLAWQVTAFMGLQSLLAYVVFGWLPTICQDRGLTEAHAGLVLAVSSFVQAIGSLIVPAVDRRLRDQRPLVAAVGVLTVAGFAGIAWAPTGLIWVSAVVLGLGQGSGFALALAFIGLRAGDAQVTARLSGMAQGVGYLIAATGPFTFGILHDVTGGWNVPVGMAVGVAVLEVVPGLAAGRARTIRHVTAETAAPAGTGRS